MFCFPFSLNIHNIADASDYAVLGVGLRRLVYWDLLVRITSGAWMCCQVEVSATG